MNKINDRLMEINVKSKREALIHPLTLPLTCRTGLMLIIV